MRIRSDNSRARIRRPARRAAALLLLLASAATAVPSRTQSLPSGSEELASIVLSEDAERRPAAAERLAATAADTGAAAAIARILRSADDPPRRAMLTAIARAPQAPASLLPPLTEAAASATPESLPEVLAAISSVRTRDAATHLLSFTADDRPEPVRAAALAALCRLTGKDELAPRAWAAWINDASQWTEAAWDAEITRCLARRADRASDGQRAATTRLIEAMRKLHLATPPDAQGAFLAGLIADPLPDLRALGFELVSRELAAGTRLDGKVGRAVVPLLSDPDPRTRERAAIVANQLAPDGAEPAVRAALLKETEPAPAAALLAAAARWPTEDLAEPALAWLATSDAARPAAAQLLLAMVRAGNLDRTEDRQRTITVLDGREPRALTPPEVRLLALLGDDDDRDRLSALLDCPEGPLRLAAADSLAFDVNYLPKILEAAGTDPLLFEIAARAVVLHGADAITFRLLAKLPTTAPDVRRRTLAWVARLMPATDLLEVSRDTDVDPGYEELVLSQLAFEERVMAEGVDPANAAAFRTGLPRLARLRIEAGRYDAALAALAPLSELDNGDTQGAIDARVKALLCLGRIEQAQDLPATSTAWLEAMERTDAPDLLKKLVEAFRTHFSSLMPDEATRLQAAADRAGP